MKRFNLFLLVSGAMLMLASCGGAETKADPEGTEKNKGAVESSIEEKIPEAGPSPAAIVPAKPDSALLKPGSNEILAKIDQYLVCNPVFIAPAAGNGIVNAIVTVKNKLADVTFQKAIVEVTIIAADGQILQSDYYPIQNIQPGDVETIKLPNAPKAASLLSRIVKVKSNQLTNGEMVLVGTHFEPGK